MGVCIITGASSGIGRAVSKAIVKNDWFESYALIGRNLEDLNIVVNEIKEEHPNILVELYICDFRDPKSIKKLIKDIMIDKTEISCLMNIAGYTDPQALLTTSYESFELTYKVNVFTPFLLIRECVKYMRKTGGKILNVASTAGMSPRPGWVSYASSKAAIISISQTLAEELAEYGIKVYCVSPGRCATKLRKRLAPDEDPTTIMQPEEVANIICDLIKPSEHCLDGQNIVIRKKI
ncbi:MAG: SDR family oxidoreductase [Clostridia bacterium]|nr:SDR family oxidoreductase [Clostridia bacterium]